MKQRETLLGLLLVAVTVFAYLPAIRDAGFIWDDGDYIIHNETLRDVDGLRAIWTDPQATPQYYPLVHTTFWVEYQLWGLTPRGYHLNNVLLHVLAALLLWRVLVRLDVAGAWLAALLFALHPVHVESVAWVTERKNVLSGVFYLGAALSYLNSTKAQAAGKRATAFYILSFILFLGALLSKTVTASLPAALLLVLWWKQKPRDAKESTQTNPPPRQLPRHILALAPFFVVALVLAPLTVWLETHHVGASGPEWDFTFIDRCLIAGRAVCFYMAKLIWPSELCFNYTRWTIDAKTGWQYLFPIAAAGAVTLLWAVRNKLGRGPLVALLFFGGTLLPALGFFDVYPMRYSFVADHFQYLASLGILVPLSVAITRLHHRMSGMGPYLAALPAGALLALLSLLTFQQCKIYQDLETLWLDTIEKNPASWMAYNNLGQLYVLQGKPEKAIPILEQTLRYNPQEYKAHKNIGVALSSLGRFEEAIEQYRKTIEIKPDDAQAYSNIGAVRVKQGRAEDAISYYRKALIIEPALAPAHSNLGSILARLNRLDEAVLHHQRAIEIMPDLATAQLRYGEALQAMGRVREAQDRYRQAITLDPTLAEAHNKLGLIAYADQLLPAAMHHFRQALKQAPLFPEAHNNLALSLARVERYDQAEIHFAESVRLAPLSAAMRITFAEFLQKRGKKSAAQDHFSAASELNPDNPDLLFHCATLDQELGRTAAAERRFRAVLAKASDHAAAHNHLAVLLAAQNKYVEAIQLLTKAVELEPKNAEFFNNLGVILVRHGNHTDALNALNTAVNLSPDYAEAVKNLNDLNALLIDRNKE